MSLSETQRLLDRYLSGECSVEEQLLLEKWLEEQGTKENEWTAMDDSRKSELIVSLYKKINQNIESKMLANNNQTKVLFLNKRRWLRIAAAAAIIILLSAGTYFIFSNKGEKEIAKTNNIIPEKTDLPPGGNKAVLTLGDNHTIVLDNAQNGTLAQQGNTKVSKLNDGQLAYNLLNDPSALHRTVEVVYNTVTTPRGGQYQLTLADGSKVWLNAASSIRFPTTFVGNERKVEITGEAYFEVAHDATKPFKVSVAGKEEVEVLGTHFNINSYSDETTINTTLLEGSVKVSSLITHHSSLITPGQQAQLNSNGLIRINANPDINEVMAWKNGMFIMNRTDIAAIMRQVSRWYDVDVVYENGVPKGTISGTVSRNLNLSQVLKVYSYSGVHFEIEGKKIIVKPE